MFPAVVERELRVALRKRRPMRSRLEAAGTGAAISAVFLLYSLLGGGRRAGQSLHQYLFLAGVYFAVIVPVKGCIGLLSEERRNQTLELLSLTGMRPQELFIQKLLGGLLVASSDLLALMPFLALPFLAGGVSFELFLTTLVCLPLLLFLSVAIALLASVVWVDEGAAFVSVIVMASLLSLSTPLPYALGKTLTGLAPFSPNWLGLSPGYAALLVGTNFAYGKPHEFWIAAGCTVLWSLLCFFLAGTILKRYWAKAQEDMPPKWRSFRELLTRGSDRWRAALRSQVLDRNAFQWLAQRQQRPVVLAWLSISVIVMLWLFGWCAWPRAWPSTFNFFVTAMLLLMVEEMFELQAAARRIGEDRRDGNLELLLTTDLTPTEIVEGQFEALDKQFHAVRLTLFGLYVLMAFAGFCIRSWNVRALILYVCIWTLFLIWCLRRTSQRTTLALWVALNTGRPTFAVFRSQGLFGGWQWFWVVYNLQRATSWLSRKGAQFPTGSTGEFVTVVVILVVVFVVYVAKRQDPSILRTRLIDSMRSIAQEPVPDPQDERFKKWKDVRQPFPEAA